MSIFSPSQSKFSPAALDTVCNIWDTQKFILKRHFNACKWFVFLRLRAWPVVICVLFAMRNKTSILKIMILDMFMTFHVGQYFSLLSSQKGIDFSFNFAIFFINVCCYLCWRHICCNCTHNFIIYFVSMKACREIVKLSIADMSSSRDNGAVHLIACRWIVLLISCVFWIISFAPASLVDARARLSATAHISCFYWLHIGTFVGLLFCVIFHAEAFMILLKIRLWVLLWACPFFPLNLCRLNYMNFDIDLCAAWWSVFSFLFSEFSLLCTALALKLAQSLFSHCGIRNKIIVMNMT